MELSNIQDLYTSHETLITSAVNLLNSNQPQPTTKCKRNLLPFLGTSLSWLTGTATTKDIHSIRTRINQIIATQSSQCDTPVHIVSILNVTRYATQVNRHSINSLMDAVHSAAQDIDNLFNVTSSLASSINFNQITLHIRSVFANLRDTMQYPCTISTHTMDYIDAATSGQLSPHILPTVDLQQMLHHITATLPPALHLPISPMDTLHFYRYLGAHVLIENKQFLLLIDIPIQDRAQQITIHQILTLDIPHGNYSAHYDINTQYFGVTTDATMGLELSPLQFELCKQANGQFCQISTPFQLLANPPTCIATLYAKSKANIESTCSLQLLKALTTPLLTQLTPDVWILATPISAPTATISLICPERPMETIPIQRPLHILKLPTACSGTLPNFYLPPRYETPTLNVNISLNWANIHAINITALHFAFGNIWEETTVIWTSNILLPYHPYRYTKYMNSLLNNSQCLMPFNMKSSEDSGTLWSLFSHPGIYISALGSVLPVGIVFSVAITFGADLPHQRTDLYNQVRCNMQLWMIM